MHMLHKLLGEYTSSHKCQILYTSSHKYSGIKDASGEMKRRGKLRQFCEDLFDSPHKCQTCEDFTTNVWEFADFSRFLIPADDRCATTSNIARITTEITAILIFQAEVIIVSLT